MGMDMEIDKDMDLDVDIDVGRPEGTPTRNRKLGTPNFKNPPTLPHTPHLGHPHPHSPRTSPTQSGRHAAENLKGGITRGFRRACFKDLRGL